MRLTIAFDDIGTPTPRMRRPDIRGKVIEAVLTRAAAAGVDDVALVSANGLNRRMTAEELQYIVGERVFRSFYADGLLTNHDAEDADNLAKIGSTVAGEIALNARAAGSDLLIFVHLSSRRPRWRGSDRCWTRLDRYDRPAVRPAGSGQRRRGRDCGPGHVGRTRLRDRCRARQRRFRLTVGVPGPP